MTQEELDELTLVAAGALFASPVDAPSESGLFELEIGLAATAVDVDEEASFWIKSVSDDILVGGRLLVPRLVVSKGIGLGSVAVTYGRVGDTDAAMLGGSIDLPLIRGGIARPVIALRGVYSQLQGVDEADFRTYGALVMIGKGIGPITPYAGYGQMRADGEARIPLSTEPTGPEDMLLLESEIEEDILMVGAKLELALLKFVVEGVQSEEWRYSARVGIGF